MDTGPDGDDGTALEDVDEELGPVESLRIIVPMQKWRDEPSEEQRKAVVVIQCAVRQMLARRRAGQLLASRRTWVKANVAEEERQMAAITIQCLVRRVMAVKARDEQRRHALWWLPRQKQSLERKSELFKSTAWSPPTTIWDHAKTLPKLKQQQIYNGLEHLRQRRVYRPVTAPCNPRHIRALRMAQLTNKNLALTSATPLVGQGLTLRQLFDSIDSNGDGYLTLSEMEEYYVGLEHIGHGAQALQRLRSHLRLMNPWGTNLVSFDEFVVLMLSYARE
eukprot:Sspe_Gene.86992::Locus_57829_Transcript_1_1_Confidence_1.000_Length_960::g.86992::m.86992